VVVKAWPATSVCENKPSAGSVGWVTESEVGDDRGNGTLRAGWNDRVNERKTNRTNGLAYRQLC